MTDNNTASDDTEKTKYWRASIALHPKYKDSFEKTLAELGLNTLGDLVQTIAANEPGLVAALKPFADKHMAYRSRDKNVRATVAKLPKATMDLLSQMDPEEVKRLAEQLQAQRAGQ